LAAAFLLGAAPAAPISIQLDGYAKRSLALTFTEYHHTLYAHCPYALGTYSYIELSGVRRVHRTVRLNDEQVQRGVEERSELILQPSRARFYWNAGKKWIDWGRGPELIYIAERRGGVWSFTRDQHICAHGEPQDKASIDGIPKG
jgi:hypothetical protein